jgi:adenosylcobinamide-phosphate guanylyltransferase
MLALIMAGGEGRRLNLGEKPLISLVNRPMISWVLDAFVAAGCDPVVVTSGRTPMTMNWCRVQGIDFYKTDGVGYVEDMVAAVRALGEEKPLFISVSDIPCINAGIIRIIGAAYRSSGKDACSAWIPSDLVRSERDGMPYREQIQGTEACPAGINILRGDHISEPQEELQILLHEPRLALNVNTRSDRENAEFFLREHP